MEEYTQLAAYKHLLQVAENILESVQTDPEILRKYGSFKKALLNKVVASQIIGSKRTVKNNSALSQINDYHLQSDTGTAQVFEQHLNQAYKKFVQKILQALTSFQSQIEVQTNAQGDMLDSRLGQSKLEDFADEIHQISIQIHSISKQLKIGTTNSKDESRLYQSRFQASEISTLANYCDNFQAKLENFKLMAEVHRKMHEIILKATKNESQKVERERQLESAIDECSKNQRKVQKELQQVNQARQFLNQYNITEQNLTKYRLASRKLTKLLYD